MRLLVGEAQFVFTHMSVPQLERCSKGGKTCLWRGQNFWVGLVFTKFFVDLQKKNVHRANLVYFSPRSRLVSKKSHHLETAAKLREVWVGMRGSLGGNFCLGGASPFAPPFSCGPDTCLQKNYLRP